MLPRCEMAIYCGPSPPLFFAKPINAAAIQCLALQCPLAAQPLRAQPPRSSTHQNSAMHIHGNAPLDNSLALRTAAGHSPLIAHPCPSLPLLGSAWLCRPRRHASLVKAMHCLCSTEHCRSPIQSLPIKALRCSSASTRRYALLCRCKAYHFLSNSQRSVAAHCLRLSRPYSSLPSPCGWSRC